MSRGILTEILKKLKEFVLQVLQKFDIADLHSHMRAKITNHSRCNVKFVLRNEGKVSVKKCESLVKIQEIT